MGESWMVTILVLAAQGNVLPTLSAQAFEEQRALHEIAAGCHRLIMAHECKSYQDALRRMPRQTHEGLLADYRATVRERLDACRCDFEAKGLADQVSQ